VPALWPSRVDGKRGVPGVSMLSLLGGCRALHVALPGTFFLSFFLGGGRFCTACVICWLVDV
jgi:hypothetical protein